MRRQSAVERFLILKERSGLSIQELADLMGYKTRSGVQRYITPGEYEGDDLPLHVVKRMDPGLIGKGPPDNPITRQDIYDLAGVVAPDYGASTSSLEKSQAKVTAWELSKIVSDLLESRGLSVDATQLAADFLERAEKALAKRGI